MLLHPVTIHLTHPTQVFNLNKRIQSQNNAPAEFPTFIRSGFDVKVIGEGFQVEGNG